MSRRLPAVRIEYPNVRPAGLRGPYGRRYPPAVGRNSHAADIRGRLADSGHRVARSVVPLQLRKRPTGLIYQDAIIGNRKASLGAWAEVNYILQNRKRLAHGVQLLYVKRLN